MNDLTLIGRSSSHYTRLARIFAIELGVPFELRILTDIMSTDAAVYGDNPALKVPVLVDGRGPLFGSENICRELARRSGKRESVVLRGDSDARIVANAEELTLHAMQTEVVVILAKVTGGPVPAKPMQSLTSTLAWLDENVDALVAALPSERALSFVETALFSLVRHLPFRDVLDVSPYGRLGAFASTFGERASARATEYRFDAGM